MAGLIWAGEAVHLRYDPVVFRDGEGQGPGVLPPAELRVQEVVFGPGGVHHLTRLAPDGACGRVCVWVCVCGGGERVRRSHLLISVDPRNGRIISQCSQSFP